MTALRIAREQLCTRPSHRAVFVSRARSRCFHVYAGPVRKGARSIPSGRRPVCGVSTRHRLRLSWGPIRTGRTLCRRCAQTCERHAPPPPALPPYELDDLVAAAWAITSHAEIHTVELMSVRHARHRMSTWAHGLVESLRAARRRYQDPSCCSYNPPSDLSLSLLPVYGPLRREDRLRLGAGARLRAPFPGTGRT